MSPSNASRSPDSRRIYTLWAFTLIELLIVIVVVAILAALVIPAATSMLRGGTESKCLNNLRQISAGMNMWAAENNSKLPPQTFAASGLQWNNPASPFFEFMLNKSGDAGDWNELLNTVLKCPGSNVKGSSDGERDNSYGRNSHLGVADYAVQDMQYFETPLARIQYPSEAVLVADWPLPNFQRYTLNSEGRKNNLWSRHGEKMNVAYVDGHAASITRKQWETWTNASAGSEEQKNLRKFLAGLDQNNPNL